MGGFWFFPLVAFARRVVARRLCEGTLTLHGMRSET